MQEAAEQILLGAYGIRPSSIQPVPAGWSASAWKVRSVDGDFFLKVYDKNKPSVKGWIERIDLYMPVTLWLHDNTQLREKMTAPVLTTNGTYKYEDAAFLYMVFPYIDGQTIGDEKLQPDQVREIAQIVAQLHTYGAELPLPKGGLRETFDISFCGALNGWLQHNPDTVLKKAMAPYAGLISHAITDLQKSAEALRQSKTRYALCHTDIHGWNLMQSNHLILVDWEGLKLAPVEADLFSFTETFFFPYAWEDFITAYRSIHKDYRVNPAAMRFYRLRRRLKDIHAFSQSILSDTLTPEEKNRSLHFLTRECALLNQML